MMFKSVGKRANIRGLALEKRIQSLYKRLGYRNVLRDVALIDKYGNRSQIDVVYTKLLFRKHYVECKNYSGKSVPLEDVAKFKEVLKLNNIPSSCGTFITTSTFTPRATTIGIHTIDGKQLKQLEKYARKRLAFQYTLLILICGVGILEINHYNGTNVIYIWTSLKDQYYSNRNGSSSSPWWWWSDRD